MKGVAVEDFPFFLEKEWIREALTQHKYDLNDDEIAHAHRLIEKIENCRSFENKKLTCTLLNKESRNILIKYMLEEIERNILKKKIYLQ